MTLVDANVLLDLVGGQSGWTDWSMSSLHSAHRRGPLFMNGVIYAEVSARFADQQTLDGALATLEIEFRPVSRPALFAAGRAHRRYRENDGPRLSILPDFIIGAHAQDLGCSLLTRDVRRYRTYFPEVQLITP